MQTTQSLTLDQSPLPNADDTVTNLGPEPPSPMQTTQSLTLHQTPFPNADDTVTNLAPDPLPQCRRHSH